MELAALLLAFEDEHVYCASIMTGYGTLYVEKTNSTLVSSTP